MSKSIEGTKTEKNLLMAFAAESQTRNLYTYFANAARSHVNKAGYEQIANIFNETAENEKVHARVFFNYLESRNIKIAVDYLSSTIKDTESNLESAVADEKMEWITNYANFEKIAIEEGFPEIASAFNKIAKAKKHHESRFRKLINNIANGEVFNKKKAARWHCINCDYIFECYKAPKECPVCKHPQIFCELLSEN